MGVREAGRWRGAPLFWLLAPLLAVLAPMAAGPVAAGAAEQTRYSLVHGCFALQPAAGGGYVSESGGGYSAGAPLAEAEPFRMQATALGRYLLYGSDRDFLALDLLGGIAPAGEPSDDADWTVAEDGAAFTITNEPAGKQLALSGSGKLVAVPAGSAGEGGRFGFAETDGCPAYPEIEVNASGTPTTGSPSYGETTGLLEGHMHGMAFEFLGGRAHCGRPWHRFGAPYALVDCPDHSGNHAGAVLENAVSSDDAISSTDGWPTFAGWPDNDSLTHENSYYKWIERAWRGGLRIWVNLLVENRVLCEIYPLKKNSCDEMDSVRLQARRMYEFQDYIDAQSGGPGKGWYRIVKNPFQARRVINEGKLAVVMGMEVSEPFGCRLLPPNAEPACDTDDIDRSLEELHDLGVRQLEIVNKFDNALTGVAGDNGETGTVTNTGNFISTGKYIDYEHCDDPENSDKEPTAAHHNDDDLIANGLEALLPPGSAPVYPPPPLCNRLALSSLGVHAIRRVMEMGMVFDPDHMSVYGRDQALSLLESERYSGIISSHSWSTESTLARIFRLGGVITPYAGSSEDFVEQWRGLREDDVEKIGKQYYGLGYGADMNGLGSQGDPRGADVPNPVSYPFKSWNGDVTLYRQRSGTRAYDINVDGVDHYGLYPDWVEDLRQIAGDAIVEDLGRGSEAYLQMWERASGIGRVRCKVLHGSFFTDRGLGRQLRLGDRPRRVLERAGQPVRRTRAWQWCARSRKDFRSQRRKVIAVFDGRGRVGLVLSTLQKHPAGSFTRGTPVRELRGGARRLGKGIWVADAGGSRRFVYRVRGGRVRFQGVARRSVAKGPVVLRRYFDRAGLR